MSRIRKVYTLLQSAAIAALSTATGTVVTTEAEAQTSSSDAYAAALATGTNAALQEFLDMYPLSPEADAAFRLLVLNARGSTLVDSSIDPTFVEGGTPEPTPPETATPAPVDEGVY